MTQPLTCPICQLPDIAPEENVCPQCDSDLTCFKALDALPADHAQAEAPAEEENVLAVDLETDLQPSSLGTTPWRPVIAISFTIGILVIVLIVFQVQHRGVKRLERLTNDTRNTLTESLRQVDAKLDALTRRQDRLLKAVEARRQRSLKPVVAPQQSPQPASPPPSADKASLAESKIATPLAPPPKKTPAKPSSASLPTKTFLIHQAKPSETLWRISQKYYGSGLYYPVLFEDNPNLSTFAMAKNAKIKIIKQKSLVRQIYWENITVTPENKKYWRYLIHPKETLTSISVKLYGTKKMIYTLKRLNRGASFKPGTRIRIVLK